MNTVQGPKKTWDGGGGGGGIEIININWSRTQLESIE